MTLTLGMVYCFNSSYRNVEHCSTDYPGILQVTGYTHGCHLLEWAYLILFSTAYATVCFILTDANGVHLFR
jgi:hypothetical protein